MMDGMSVPEVLVQRRWWVVVLAWVVLGDGWCMCLAVAAMHPMALVLHPVAVLADML